MTERILTEEKIEAFQLYLISEEKSKNTVEKYMRDVRTFAGRIGEKNITKSEVLAYKTSLIAENYAPRSINSMLASLNSLFSFLGWLDCKVKSLRIQRQIYCAEKKELTRAEYERLVRAAQKRGNERLALLLQTICSTGIRVSELSFITVASAKCGEVEITLKGKSRRILLPKALQQKLLSYSRKKGIKSGPIFLTRSGRPLSRSNIWREMKKLCADAQVDPNKVFPHNLRHLFARIFYGIKRDIAKLADVLGHSSIETTRIYVVSTGSEHRRYLDSMRLLL